MIGFAGFRSIDSFLPQMDTIFFRYFSLTLALSLALSLSHTHTHTHTQILTCYPHTLTNPLSFSHSNTQTHTAKHTHVHSQRRTLKYIPNQKIPITLALIKTPTHKSSPIEQSLRATALLWLHHKICHSY